MIVMLHYKVVLERNLVLTLGNSELADSLVTAHVDRDKVLEEVLQ